VWCGYYQTIDRSESDDDDYNQYCRRLLRAAQHGDELPGFHVCPVAAEDRGVCAVCELAMIRPGAPGAPAAPPTHLGPDPDCAAEDKCPGHLPCEICDAAAGAPHLDDYDCPEVYAGEMWGAHRRIGD
jgi:hypothetical protein